MTRDRKEVHCRENLISMWDWHTMSCRGEDDTMCNASDNMQLGIDEMRNVVMRLAKGEVGCGGVQQGGWETQTRSKPEANQKQTRSVLRSL